MTKSETKAQPDAQAYNLVTGRTTLNGIWMTESRFDLKPEAIDPVEPMRHDVRTEVNEVILDGEGALYGFIRFSASSRLKRQRVIHVSAKYFVSYYVDGGCEQSLAELFIDRVGRLAAYPYFRALTASLVAQAGVNIPALPIMSFLPRNISFASDGAQ